MEEKKKFEIKFIEPYTTMQNGKAAPVPSVVEGMLTQGGFSIIGAKPKHYKSSFSRAAGVAVSKGTDFLGRKTTKGEVILVSLEDPINHVDNCLSALGYDPANDARIRIVDKLPPNATQAIDALGEQLSVLSDVRLIVIDTLPKVLRVTDLNDYMKVLGPVEQLRNLAKERFPHLHILA